VDKTKFTLPEQSKKKSSQEKKIDTPIQQFEGQIPRKIQGFKHKKTQTISLPGHMPPFFKFKEWIERKNNHFTLIK